MTTHENVSLPLGILCIFKGRFQQKNRKITCQNRSMVNVRNRAHPLTPLAYKTGRESVLSFSRVLGYLGHEVLTVTPELAG